MSKKSTKNVAALSAVIMLNGMDDFKPLSDTAFDIETRPLTLEGNGLTVDAARVVAIGYYQPIEGRYFIAYDDDEAAMLEQFWQAYLSAHGAGARLLGFNIFGFDLPFLIRRSWLHGVKVPKNLLTFGGRTWNDTFVDLMHVWKCGEWKNFISLDALSQYLGVGAKNGSGEFFWKEWDSNRQSAIDYLKNDVKLVIDCANKMGITAPQVA